MYGIITGLVNCGLWEYEVARGELSQSAKVTGNEMGFKIANFRKTLLAAKLIHEDDLAVFGELCDSLEHGDEAFTYDLRAKTSATTAVWLRFEGYTVYSGSGVPEKVIGRTTNVEEEKKQEELVIREADRDPVTGVYTEVGMQEPFEKAVADAGETKLAFFLLDVDDFASITDTWGNAYGDYVLEKLAKAIRGVFPDTDTVSRTVENEFVIVRKGIGNPAEIYALARSLERMAEQIELKRESKLTLSVGVSVYPIDGKDYTSLYKKAGIALEETKRNPNSNCTLFDESMMAHRVYRNERETAAEPKTENQKIVEEQQTSQYGPVEKYIVNKTFDMLAATESDPDEVVKILAEIGKYYHYSKVYTINYDKVKRSTNVRYTWEPKENPFVSVFDTIVRTNWNSIKSRFVNDPIFISTNTAQLGLRMPEQMKEYYPDASLFQYNVINNSETFVALSFEKEVGQNWSKEEQDVLIHIAKLLGIYMERIRIRESLADEVRYTRAIIENQKITSYAVIPENFELVYVGDYTGRQYPKAHSGEHCYSAIMGRSTPCKNCPVMGLKDGKTVHTTENYYEKQNRWISTTASIITSEQKKEENDSENPENALRTPCLVCWSDVTEFVDRVRSKDVLTGQLTAERFEVEATRLLSEDRRKNHSFISFSFPQFADVTDVWGYQTGNEVMKVFAASVASNLHEKELFARITGANFAMMIDFDDRERTEARVSMMLDSAHGEVLRLYPDLRLDVWCGIFRMQGRELAVSEALERAGIARKNIGSMQDLPTVALSFYTDDMKQVNSFREFVEKAMRDALDNREFKVFFQPRRDKEGQITGADALVRWITAEGQVLEPTSFEPIFEENGFITELDYYVHKEMFRLMKEWIDSGVEPPVVGVSSSWQYLFSPDFLNRTKYLLQRYHIPAELVEMKIPETVNGTDINLVLELLTQLQDMGFRVEIDDYLAKCAMGEQAKELPLDQLRQNPNFLMFLRRIEQKRLMAPVEASEFMNEIGKKK